MVIESIINKLNSIPSDKVYHFAGGVLIFAAALPIIGVLSGFLTVVIIGAAKEVYDYLHRDRHTPDVWDAVATVFGGLVGLFCSLF